MSADLCTRFSNLRRGRSSVQAERLESHCCCSFKSACCLLCVLLSDFVDHRFWTLVGVPYPTLPPQSSNAPLPSAVVAPAAAAAVSAAMSDRDGDVIMNGGGPVVAGFAAAPPAAASASSVPAPASSPLASAFDAYSDLHTAYDLVLSDGTLQLKVLLSPTLSIHVEKGGVLPRGLVRISEAVWRFDETVVDDRGFLVVRAMEVLETQADAGLILTAAAGAEPQPLQYPAWASPSMRIDRPLIGGPRSYYLSLFNDDTVTFSAESYPAVSEAERITQEQKAIHQGVAEAVKEERKDGGGGGAAAAAGSSGSALIRRGRQAQIAAATAAASGRLPMLMQDSVLLEPEVLQTGDVTTIRKLITEGVGWQAGDLSLIVRVFAKSRIQTFGRKTVGGAGGAGDLLRAPFNFELLVGDASGEQIKVVLWNTLVGTYFSRLHVGQILALRGFRLKKARSDGHYELALNPYNPIGSVRVFDQRLSGLSKDLADAVPPMVMTISRVSEVAAMAEENIFDVAGVVTFAGPMLREFSSAKQSSVTAERNLQKSELSVMLAHCFVFSRWICLVSFNIAGCSSPTIRAWTRYRSSSTPTRSRRIWKGPTPSATCLVFACVPLPCS